MVFNRGASPAPIFPKGVGAASVHRLAEKYFFYARLKIKIPVDPRQPVFLFKFL
jgi:hypothetical protein